MFILLPNLVKISNKVAMVTRCTKYLYKMHKGIETKRCLRSLVSLYFSPHENNENVKEKLYFYYKENFFYFSRLDLGESKLQRDLTRLPPTQVS